MQSDRGKGGKAIGLRACFAVGLFLLVPGLFAGCQRQTEELIEEDAFENMILIPAGKFVMGSDEVDKEALQQRFGMTKVPYLNEHPKREIHLDDYFIDKYEVTNKEYKKFVDTTKHNSPSYWVNGNYPTDSADKPVVMVTWFDADAYCKWKALRLPTEAEWEKAARGTDGRRFPWGSEFNQDKTNSLGLQRGVTPVGHFEEDVSPYGLYDVAGNVSEWTDSWYKAYPGNKFEETYYGETYKVVRGGSWGGIGHYSFDFYYRPSFRNYAKPQWSLNDLGFRCVKSK